MMTKIFAALLIAVAISCAPFAVQAHEGHHHPAAKSKKVKKAKLQRCGFEIRLMSRVALG
jgi:hypothetical protein